MMTNHYITNLCLAKSIIRTIHQCFLPKPSHKNHDIFSVTTDVSDLTQQNQAINVRKSKRTKNTWKNIGVDGIAKCKENRITKAVFSQVLWVIICNLHTQKAVIRPRDTYAKRSSLKFKLPKTQKYGNQPSDAIKTRANHNQLNLP